MIRKVNPRVVRGILCLVAFIAVFYPVYVWFQSAGLFASSSIYMRIFPVFGLMSFSIMWLHVVGGAVENFLGRYVDFRKFVNQTSAVVLLFLILHPLLFFVNLTFPQINKLLTTGKSVYIWVAIVAWTVFIVYDIAKIFKNRRFLSKNWKIIKFVSTLGFFLVLFHSLNLGSNLQEGSLRYVWIFYGVTAAIATFYTYVIKNPSQ